MSATKMTVDFFSAEAVLERADRLANRLATALNQTLERPAGQLSLSLNTAFFQSICRGLLEQGLEQLPLDDILNGQAPFSPAEDRLFLDTCREQNITQGLLLYSTTAGPDEPLRNLELQTAGSQLPSGPAFVHTINLDEVSRLDHTRLEQMARREYRSGQVALNGFTRAACDVRLESELTLPALKSWQRFITTNGFRTLYIISADTVHKASRLKLLFPLTNLDYCLHNTVSAAELACLTIKPAALTPRPILSALWLCAVQSALSGLDVEVTDTSQQNEPVYDFYYKKRRALVTWLVMSLRPSKAFEVLERMGVLHQTLSELAEGRGLSQNRYHSYDIFFHSLYACDASLGYPLHIRFAALMHDLGKVVTRREHEDGNITFHNHEVISARLALRILARFSYDQPFIDRVVFLVRQHMFHYTDEWSDRAIRRFLKKVHHSALKEMILLRLADRRGSGRAAVVPLAIKNLVAHLDRVEADEKQLKVKDLAVGGEDIRRIFGLEPGPEYGRILDRLLEQARRDPSLNNRDSMLELLKQEKPQTF